jgi:hypothetical protein
MQEQHGEEADKAPQEEPVPQPKKPREITRFIGMMGMFDWHRENQGVATMLPEFG